MNDDKSDNVGIDPETFERSLRLEGKESDSASLRTSAHDKNGDQGDKDNEHKGQIDDDTECIDIGPASQLRHKSTGRQKVGTGV